MSAVATFTKAWACARLYQYLSRDYQDLACFKAGIIDKNGKQLIKTKDMTPSQRRMFGPFEKLLLYVKRTLKKHGVTSLALAMTFLEEKRYDEFISYVESKNTFLAVESLIEDIDPEEYEEDTPTTASANIAGTALPLGMTRRKPHVS